MIAIILNNTLDTAYLLFWARDSSGT